MIGRRAAALPSSMRHHCLVSGSHLRLIGVRPWDFLSTTAPTPTAVRMSRHVRDMGKAREVSDHSRKSCMRKTVGVCRTGRRWRWCLLQTRTSVAAHVTVPWTVATLPGRAAVPRWDITPYLTSVSPRDCLTLVDASRRVRATQSGR